MLDRSWIYLYGCFGTAPNKNKKERAGATNVPFPPGICSGKILCWFFEVVCVCVCQWLQWISKCGNIETRYQRLHDKWML